MRVGYLKALARGLACGGTESGFYVAEFLPGSDYNFTPAGAVFKQRWPPFRITIQEGFVNHLPIHAVGQVAALRFSQVDSIRVICQTGERIRLTRE